MNDVVEHDMNILSNILNDYIPHDIYINKHMARCTMQIGFGNEWYHYDYFLSWYHSKYYIDHYMLGTHGKVFISNDINIIAERIFSLYAHLILHTEN